MLLQKRHENISSLVVSFVLHVSPVSVFFKATVSQRWEESERRLHTNADVLCNVPGTLNDLELTGLDWSQVIKK